MGKRIMSVGKNKGTCHFISIGKKYYKYSLDRTNLTQFTLSFHGFAYVEPLRKTLNNFFCCFEQGVIQVDIGGHPPFPNGSKQFSGHFGNLLFLAGFHFRGHFEGLNEVFSRSRFSMISKGMIEPPK
jgi:hypothetical protein